MPNYTDTKVNDMIFNILTSDQYNTLRTGGQLNSNQLYFVTDDLQKTLTIQLNGGTTEGTNKFTYDGSATKSINITPASIGALSVNDATAGASQWTTARDFIIKDADNTNTGTATSVDGTADVILHLPTTIKANLTGNASSANKVNNSLTIQLNSGTTETGANPNKFVFDGSATKTINITPSSIGAVSKTGDTMTGNLTFTDGNKIYFINDGSTGLNTPERTIGFGISGQDGGGNNAVTRLYFTVSPSTQNQYVAIDGIATVSGDHPHYIANKEYVDNKFAGAATSDHTHQQLTIQLNGGTTQTGNTPNMFVYDGSVTKTINITPASIGALASGSAATSAAKWTTARDFKIASSDGSNESAAVSVDGSGNVILKLASTIKASLSGNATSADKVNSSLTIQLNGGTTEDGSSPNKFVYDGSGTKTVNITPAAISAVNKTGDTMTGLLTLSGDPTSAMHAVTKQYADGLIAAADAMRYKGTISGGATTPGTYTPAGSAGDTYRVDTAGYINGEPVEVGDLIICNADSTTAATSSTYSTVKAKWNIIQVNIDNAVFRGDNVLASGAILIGDSTPGKVKNLTDPVGSNTRPIYLASPGVPTALEYTANRLYYSKSTTSYEAGTHYASATKIAINSTSEPVANLHINGTTSATDTITVTKGNTGSPKIAVSNGTHVASILVGSGGTNHGLYSDTATATWIIYRSGGGDVFVPKWASVGSSTQPVCFDNNGKPIAISYTFGASVAHGTQNRIVYYTSDSAIGAASTHYISNTQMSIGATTTPGTGVSLYVSGKTVFNDNVQLKSALRYSNASASGLDANTSDLINLYGLYFNNSTNSSVYGLHFANGTANKWDTIYAYGGLIHFDANHSTGSGSVGKIIPHTGNTTGTVGSSSIGVYIDAGQIKAMSKSLSANVGPGTQYAVAYYDAADSITSISAAGAANTALMGKGSAAPEFVAVNPSISRAAAGTTAGEQIKITVLGVGSSNLTLDSASASQSGVITTGAQTIAGVKTFSSDLVVSSATSSTSRSTGALRVAGGIAAVEQISGLRFQVDNHVLLEYNETTLSLDFIFS